MDRKPVKLIWSCLLSVLLLVGWFYLSDGTGMVHAILFIRYVAPGGQCGSNSPCYERVQDAVDAANTGDEIRVAAGTYTGVSDRNGTTQVVFINKSLVIRGGYHPLLWTQDPTVNPTILDAQKQGRVLYITGNVSPTIEGFHLTNGSATNGGGVYIDTACVNVSWNEIYDNWAASWGGGVYLKNSATTLGGNHIYSNTTGESGRGGGVAISDSPATVDDNIIEDNRAHVGGGIEMNNTLGTAGALLTGNIIRNNVAFDYGTYDGAGGGIDTYSYLTDTLRNNTISRNTAKWGGGVHAFGATVIIASNLIQENNAPTHGGGLYVQYGQLTLDGNNIMSNTAGSWGGGLYLRVNTSIIHGNTFQGNTAGWRGGGMYAQSMAQFDGNLFLGNTAVEQGGGVFSYHDTGAVYMNSVFNDNQAVEGGGIYLWGSDSQFIHSTIANNMSGDGRAVVIDKYPGLVNPGTETIYTATIVFSNTIISEHPVGFYATVGNSLTVDGILWHAVPTHFQAAGVDLEVLHERSGNPAFQPDGYHLRLYSAAQGGTVSSLDHDVDGQLRDWGDQKDLGADEYVPTALIDPEHGGNLIYINPQEDVTITLSVPPHAVTVPTGLMFSPFPPLPPDVMDSPFGTFVAIGPPFRLDPFHLDASVPITNPVDPPLGEPLEPLVFGFPAHLVEEYGLEKLKMFREAMDRLEAQLLALIGPGRPESPKPPQDPACGPVNHDLDNRKLDVPICNTGILTSTFQSAYMLPLQALVADSEPGTFIFVIEIEKTMIYLPIIMR